MDSGENIKTAEILNNGLTLINCYIPSTDKIYINFQFNISKIDETKENLEILKLIHELILCKTKTRNKQQLFIDCILNFNGDIKGGVVVEKTSYNIVLPKNNINAIEIIADILQNFDPSEDDIKKEKEKILQKCKDVDEDHKNFIYYSDTILKDSVYSIPYNEKEKSINSFTKEQILDYYHKYYTSENLTIITTGNINIEELKIKLNKYFQNFMDLSIQKLPIERKPELIYDFKNCDVIRYKTDLNDLSSRLNIILKGSEGFDPKEQESFKILCSVFNKILLNQVRGKDSLCYHIEVVLNDFYFKNLNFLRFALNTEKDINLVIDSILIACQTFIENKDNFLSKELLYVKNHFIKFYSDLNYNINNLHNIIISNILPYMDNKLSFEENFQKRINICRDINVNDLLKLFKKVVLNDIGIFLNAHSRIDITGINVNKIKQKFKDLEKYFPLNLENSLENIETHSKLETATVSNELISSTVKNFNTIKSHKVLPNGLTLDTCYIDNYDKIKITFTFNIGGLDENEENCGISHFTEHSINLGTEKRTKQELKIDIEKNNFINFNQGSTTLIDTLYFIECHNIKEVESAIEIISDMLQNSKFEQNEIDNERIAILEEESNINIKQKIGEKYLNNIFKKFVSVIGTRENINKFNSEELYEHYKKYYTADNLTITATGNITNEKLEQLINQFFPKFTDYSIQKEPRKKEIDINEEFNRNSCKIEQNIDLNENIFNLIFKGINTNSPDYETFDFVRQIFKTILELQIKKLDNIAVKGLYFYPEINEFLNFEISVGQDISFKTILDSFESACKIFIENKDNLVERSLEFFKEKEKRDNLFLTENQISAVKAEELYQYFDILSGRIEYKNNVLFNEFYQNRLDKYQNITQNELLKVFEQIILNENNFNIFVSTGTNVNLTENDVNVEMVKEKLRLLKLFYIQWEQIKLSNINNEFSKDSISLNRSKSE